LELKTLVVSALVDPAHRCGHPNRKLVALAALVDNGAADYGRPALVVVVSGRGAQCLANRTGRSW
jgi:hypothetical protein